VTYETSINIGTRTVDAESPTYFIADVASNHDGDLERAKHLIHLCAEAGADCAKFQHFLAKDIVSDYGFRNLGGQMAHQAAWEKPVYEVYEDYELNRSWNGELARTAGEAGIDFMTTPYDFQAVEEVAPLVPAYKIGSGDITWTDMLRRVAREGKPVLLATGASAMDDVVRAVEAVLAENRQLLLMQCNTNYTGDPENFRYVNLRVLDAFGERWPGMPLGLSDHTPGHAAVLGAIALGARAVEKHFTDDNDRVGPDHAFSLNPATWREMVDRSRELELALGDGEKRIEPNERDSAIVQRRALRLRVQKQAGDELSADDLESLRPAPEGTVPPYALEQVVGRRLSTAKDAGEALVAGDVEG
jgi:N-acetylneuraminate synthase